LRRFLLCLLATFGLIFSGHAAEPDLVLKQSRSLESGALSLLGEHFRFEEGLLTPDNDKMMVFLSLPHGARVIIDQVTLRIDGKVAATYSYSGVEMLNFQRRSVHLLHIGRIATGEHTLRLDVKVIQGNVRAMKDFVFFKSDNPKFIDLQLAGYDVREVFATDW